MRSAAVCDKQHQTRVAQRACRCSQGLPRHQNKEQAAEGGAAWLGGWGGWIHTRTSGHPLPGLLGMEVKSEAGVDRRDLRELDLCLIGRDIDEVSIAFVEAITSRGACKMRDIVKATQKNLNYGI